MRIRGKDLSYQDVLKRLAVGLLVLVLFCMWMLVIGTGMALAFWALAQCGSYFVHTIIPFLVYHPKMFGLMLGLLPIVIAVVILAFVVGDDIMTEKEERDRLWKMN